MYKYLLKTLPIIVIALVFNACNTNNQDITDKEGKSISIHTVVENQKVKKDTAVSYSYVLPKSYDGKTNLPVLFVIDPHAAVDKPLLKYKSLASSHGYIFIASENIKNGMSGSESQKIINALIQETKLRFSIDEKRMFISGFSGGAKLAINFAQQIPELIGVIACGGSIPLMVSEKPTYYYTGVVGNKDFNFLEVQQTFSVFDQQGYDFTSIIFDGAHEWPPVESFDLALASMNIYAMKTKRLAKDEIWIKSLHQRMLDSITEQKSRGEILLAHQSATLALRWFNGLQPLKELNKQALLLRQNPQLNTEMQKTQTLIKKEVKLRSAFIKAIQTQDLVWWTSEIEKINSSINTKNKTQAQVSQRLLNYLSMACFMLTKTDLDDGKLDQASKKIKIYEMVDPDNYDMYLMYARFYMLTGENEKMHQSYKKAQELGFTDNETYAKDASWAKLMATV